MVFGLTGGLGLYALPIGLSLLLLGIGELSSSAMGLLGSRLLGREGKDRLRGFAAGLVSSALGVSSSAATSAAMGMAGGGLITFKGALYYLLGSSLGSSLFTLFLSFPVSPLYSSMLGLGLILRLRGRGAARWGRALVGGGLSLMGIDVLSSFASYAPPALVEGALSLCRLGPAGQMAFGFLASSLLFSSSSAVGLFVSLARGGLVEPGAFVPLVLGAHLGSSATALLLSLGRMSQARRLALAGFLYKALFVLPALPACVALGLNPAPMALPFVHAAVASANALVALPLAERGMRLLYLLVPEGTYESLSRPRFLGPDILEAGEVVVKLVERELGRACNQMERALCLTAEALEEGKEVPKDALELAMASRALLLQCLAYSLEAFGVEPERRGRLASACTALLEAARAEEALLGVGLAGLGRCRPLVLRSLQRLCSLSSLAFGSLLLGDRSMALRFDRLFGDLVSLARGDEPGLVLFDPSLPQEERELCLRALQRLEGLALSLRGVVHASGTT